jgi:hypothetical protein
VPYPAEPPCSIFHAAARARRLSFRRPACVCVRECVM